MKKEKSDVPVVDRLGTLLHPSDEAAGPYGGLHGGVVSGMLVGDLERQATEKGWGQSLSATAWLLRPCAMADLSPRTDIIKSGARLTMAENALYAGEKIQAKAAVTFMNEVPNGQLKTPPGEIDPEEEGRIEALPELILNNPNRSAEEARLPIFGDAIEMRQDSNMIWSRPLRPLLPGAGPLARVISLADFATVFSVVLDGSWPKMGWPNANITVHLFRPPVGDWVGVQPKSHWFSTGNGMTEAVLLDSRGVFGRSCQNVALSEIAADPGKQIFPDQR